MDTHAHIFRRDLPFLPEYRRRRIDEFSARDYLALLDANGVSYGVIAALSWLGDYHDYTLDVLRRHPRLRATIQADTTLDDARLSEMDEAGVVGVRLQWRGRTDYPDLRSGPYHGLIRRVARLGWHVHVLATNDGYAQILPPLIDAGVDVVIDHFGAPSGDRGLRGPGTSAILRAAQTGRVWVKISAGFRLRVADDAVRSYAQTYLRELGPDFLLWGSDAPFLNAPTPTTYSDVLAAYRRYVPQAAARERMSHAALVLYFGGGRCDG